MAGGSSFRTKPVSWELENWVQTIGKNMHHNTQVLHLASFLHCTQIGISSTTTPGSAKSRFIPQHSVPLLTALLLALLSLFRYFSAAPAVPRAGLSTSGPPSTVLRWSLSCCEQQHCRHFSLQVQAKKKNNLKEEKERITPVTHSCPHPHRHWR